MSLSSLTKRTLVVSRGLTYTYYTSPAQASKPTLILFHGWPDTAKLFAGLVNNYLVPNGYGIIALDCLGYGDSSKPTDMNSYAWHHMTADAVEILDAEDIQAVISLGHDWGAVLCQRLYNFYPSRVIGVVLINVAYMEPTGKFDLDAVNANTREEFGSGIYEYWYFYTAEDGPSLMKKNLESVYTVAFSDPHTWLINWCSPDGMRRYITEGRTQPTLPYADATHKKEFMDRLSRDGFEAPSCWYKSFRHGIQAEADNMVAEKNKMITVPVLFWGGEQDFVCRPSALQKSIDAGLLPDLKKVTREGGHWALLEKPTEFGQDILAWLRETYQ